MAKLYNIMLVILVLFLSGCNDNLTETNTIKKDILIKQIALAEDESIKLPPEGLIPCIYDYEVKENIKTILIEVVDYTDVNNSYVTNSYAFKINEETLEGKIYIKYFTDNNELSIEIKSGKQINKISNVLEIYDKTDGYVVVPYCNESILKKGKPIPLYNILYADGFSSDIEEFPKNPKHRKDNYSSAYQITITFLDKYINVK